MNTGVNINNIVICVSSKQADIFVEQKMNKPGQGQQFVGSKYFEVRPPQVQMAQHFHLDRING